MEAEVQTVALGVELKNKHKIEFNGSIQLSPVFWLSEIFPIKEF